MISRVSHPWLKKQHSQNTGEAVQRITALPTLQQECKKIPFGVGCKKTTPHLGFCCFFFSIILQLLDFVLLLFDFLLNSHNFAMHSTPLLLDFVKMSKDDGKKKLVLSLLTHSRLNWSPVWAKLAFYEHKTSSFQKQWYLEFINFSEINVIFKLEQLRYKKWNSSLAGVHMHLPTSREQSGLILLFTSKKAFLQPRLPPFPSCLSKHWILALTWHIKNRNWQQLLTKRSSRWNCFHS